MSVRDLKTCVRFVPLLSFLLLLAGSPPDRGVAQALGGANDVQELPPDEAGAEAHLDASPRHGEWVEYAAGEGDRVTAWVVYPERSGPAPVVVVIHEIYALTDWIRAVADQLAAEGFIAIAPDLLSGKGPEGGGTESVDRQEAVRLIRDLEPDEVTRRLRSAAAYATGLPAATEDVAAVGFCWGGSTSFRVATEWPELDAAVVFYGSSPPSRALSRIQAPVLGLYGGDDARVNATVPEARETMEALGKAYEVNIYEGAGHGFLRNRSGRDGANRRAARAAWSRALSFLQDHLEE
jgi:carboxymethylenebutenolidase